MHDDNLLFLTTKTLPPRRTRSVMSRPRLNALAAQVRQRLLTVVKGPPGYGKTTLARAWSNEIAATGARVAWLSLDPSDNDVNRLVFYMAAALNRACPEVGKMRQDMLAGLSVVQPDRLISLLIGGLAEQPHEVFLFVDDTHYLTQPAVIEVLSILLRHASGNLHLVLVGRTDLSRSLMSLVGLEDLLEVDAATLRFNLDETGQLVRKLRQDPLAPAEIQALYSMTEGWPAAVRAILLALTNHNDPQHYLRRMAGNIRPISALLEDLLDQMPAELIAFMIRIAIVDKICAPLAEALTGAANGQRLLDQIEQRQLFFSARDAQARWFGFHRLFREQLERRLQSHLGSEVALLHRRAAHWFAGHELWSDAVGHALAAGDTQQAVAWIEQCAMRLVETGELLTLLSWQNHLRDHLLESPMRLRLAFSWASGLTMAGIDAVRQVDRIETDLDRAAQDAETENLRWECRALRSMLTNVNDDSETAGRLAQQYLAHDTRDSWITNVMLNVVSTTHLMAGRWASFYAVPPLMLADETGASTGRYVFNLAYRLCYQGIAEYQQGRLQDAAVLLEDAMRVGNGDGETGKPGADPASDRVIWALPAGLLAQVRYQQNRLPESAALIGECLELVKIAAPLDFAAAAFLTASRLANLEGNGARARAILEEAERLAMLLERTRLCLIDGRLPESTACVIRLDALTAAASNAGVRKAYISRDAALAHAWMEMAQGAPERALPRLGRRLEAALSAGLPLEAARAGATMALACLRASDRAGAIRLLREACDRVVRSNAVRVFFDLPVTAASMQSLLRDCLGSPPPHPELAKFMSRLANAPHLPAPGVSGARQSVETLSGRERHILTLLAQGRSNKEIARALGVAPDTVKYHLKSVFSKLDVRNRVQAAAQAQSFGLT